MLRATHNQSSTEFLSKLYKTSNFLLTDFNPNHKKSERFQLFELYSRTSNLASDESFLRILNDLVVLRQPCILHLN